MSEKKRRMEESIEDVQRISDTLNRKAKKVKKKNSYLNLDDRKVVLPTITI